MLPSNISDSATFSVTMARQDTEIGFEHDLRALEVQVEELIRVCTRLKEENDALRKNNSVACNRVEAILEKLNLFETGSSLK